MARWKGVREIEIFSRPRHSVPGKMTARDRGSRGQLTVWGSKLAPNRAVVRNPAAIVFRVKIRSIRVRKGKFSGRTVVKKSAAYSPTKHRSDSPTFFDSRPGASPHVSTLESGRVRKPTWQMKRPFHFPAIAVCALSPASFEPARRSGYKRVIFVGYWMLHAEDRI